MKTLIWDIENSPVLAWTWGLWDQNIGINMVVKPMETLCFAARWYEDPKMLFYSSYHDGKDAMIQAAHALLDEADAVISWNGIRHDSPHLHREFLQADMPPPSPYQDIDLLSTSRKRFKFESNKLDYVAQKLGLGKKAEHEGFDLWLKCMDGDEAAWGRMKRYNIQDVRLTTAVYDKFKPWIKTHPSYGSHNAEDSCPNCGSKKLIMEGLAYTQTGQYQRWHCADCGRWARSTQRTAKTNIVGLNS